MKKEMKLNYKVYGAEEVRRNNNIPPVVKVYFTTGNDDRCLYEISGVGYIVKIPNPFPNKDRVEFKVIPETARGRLNKLLKELENE